MFVFAIASFLAAVAATCFAVRPCRCRCNERPALVVYESEDKIHIRRPA